MRTIITQGFRAIIPAKKCLTFAVHGEKDACISCFVKGMARSASRGWEALGRYPTRKKATDILDELNAWLVADKEDYDHKSDFDSFLMPDRKEAE